MIEYSFRVVIAAQQVHSHDEMLNLTERLMAAGCDDGTVGGHDEGAEVVFDRVAESREDAMASAVRQIESCGLKVLRVELDRETIAA